MWIGAYTYLMTSRALRTLKMIRQSSIKKITVSIIICCNKKSLTKEKFTPVEQIIQFLLSFKKKYPIAVYFFATLSLSYKLGSIKTCLMFCDYGVIKTLANGLSISMFDISLEILRLSTSIFPSAYCPQLVATLIFC